MYCPACGNNYLLKFPNNTRLADFFCDNCGEVYELKSTGSTIGKTILDGAYYAALERINSSTNPKHFFTPDILSMSWKNRQLSLCRLILSHRVFHETLGLYFRSGTPPRHHRNHPYHSAFMLHQRRHTFAACLNCQKLAQLDNWTHYGLTLQVLSLQAEKL